MKNLNKDPRQEAMMEMMVEAAPTGRGRLSKDAGAGIPMEGQDKAQEQTPEQGRHAIDEAVDNLLESGTSVDEILRRLSAENDTGDETE